MDKLKEWTGSGIVGGVAFAAFTMVASWLTGSWAVVWVFVKLHFWESLLCTLVALGAGIVVGLAIRGHIDKKKLAAKDAEIAAVRAEYEDPARRMREKAANMSDAAKAILAYCIEAPAPPMFEGVRDAGTITRGMLEVRDSGLVKWDPVGGVAAVVTVLPEARAAITANDELMGSMRKALSAYRHEIVERNHSTLPNMSTRSEYRILGLTPAESEMVLAIRDSGSIRVGTKWLQVAKSLKSLGVIYRRDAPSSDVIEECDVLLTDEWRQMVEEAMRNR